MVSLLWLLFVTVISIVLHEMAHAFAARACGFDVFAMRFGLGKTIREWRWNGMEVSFGFPASLAVGLVEFSDRGRGTIPQKLFVAVAGVLANAALMFLANWLDADPHLQAGRSYWALLGVSNMVLVVFNLLPIATSRRGSYTRLWSDGGVILGLLQQQFSGRNFTERR